MPDVLWYARNSARATSLLFLPTNTLDIAAMEPAERLALREDLFGQYCDACCGEPTCQCWNDE